MQRRDFLKDLTAAGLLSMLDPHYLAAKENLQAGNRTAGLVPKCRFGRTEDMISIICFGGIVVKNVSPNDAADHVASAVERGVNYFDVAPTYGNAQDRLGPALKPHRDKCFLACKTQMRDAAGAQAELEDSLRALQTDHFDLYQLHSITTPDDVEQAFASGGAMETLLRARDQGKVRHLGFSAHSEVAALSAMEQFEFDSIMFPLSISTWIKGEFGSPVHKQARENNLAIIALKAMAYQKWTKSTERRWDKTWYEPFDEIDKVALGLRFSRHLPVDAMIPPGQWELFEMAVNLAQAGGLTPLNSDEQQIVAALAAESDPIFTKSA